MLDKKNVNFFTLEKNNMDNKKVVLAFSGGLDSSYCALYLSNQKGLQVYSATVNTGGFNVQELEKITRRATSLNVVQHKNIEATQSFYQQVVKYLIYGNVLKNNTYPLSVSAERVHQAIQLIEYAKQIEAAYIAHCSTGAGNDQIRFDLIFQVLAPHIQILTPIRENKLTRQQETDYLNTNGVETDFKKAKYSINKGLWGTSIGGDETLTSDKPLPEEAFLSHAEKTETTRINLLFEKGEIVGVNNQLLNPVKAIQQLDKIASAYAIGRDYHIGDTIIGIKGRIGIEAAAATIIIKAHHALEKHTLSKWQLQLKTQLADWYGMFVHEANGLDPVMKDIERFLESSQRRVTGKVWVHLMPYHFVVSGVESKFDLMNSKSGVYGEINNDWTGEDAKSFTKILSNSLKIYNSMD